MASKELNETVVDESWKTQTLLAGGLIGLVTGVGAAYLLVRQAEREQGEVAISAGKGLSLGMLVLGLLRQIGQLGE